MRERRILSITADNGTEFSRLAEVFPEEYIYYAHPYCAWERGSNENQNKLIRRFVPKGTDISKLTAKDVKRIQHWINQYPRRQFGYKSSSQMSTLKVA